jgi:FkbM family methyltransferase
MSSEIVNDTQQLAPALAIAGQDDRLRSMIFDALREAELRSENPALFRETVRWPLILSLLADAKSQRVILHNGLIFEVGADSRIEKALLLSTVAHPDHVWEPQTTKLLTLLARGASNVIFGGAYIGDQAVPVAREIAGASGVVHAFEPMEHAFKRLLRHLYLNELSNVIAHRLALWSQSNVALRLEGHLALASSLPVDEQSQETVETVDSITIDEYVASRFLPAVELIMLDTEGGEEHALRGACETIVRNYPNIVFEIHRNFVDWSQGLEQTSIVKLLRSHGYELFAIRDFHNNYPTTGYPIEIVPVATVYLEGPPHGINVLATRDAELIGKLDLRVIENVSPKLLLHKDPALHHPRFTS